MFPWNASDVVAWLSYVNSRCLFFYGFSVEGGDVEAGKVSFSPSERRRVSDREGQRVISDEGFAPARHEKEEGETADVEGDRRKDGRVVTCGEKETRRNLRELKERPVRLCRLTGRIFCGGDEEI